MPYLILSFYSAALIFVATQVMTTQIATKSNSMNQYTQPQILIPTSESRDVDGCNKFSAMTQTMRKRQIPYLTNCFYPLSRSAIAYT